MFISSHLTAPLNPLATYVETSSDSVHVEWGAVANTNVYQLRLTCDQSGIDSLELLSNVILFEYDFTNVPPGTRCELRIQAIGTNLPESRCIVVTGELDQKYCMSQKKAGPDK